MTDDPKLLKKAIVEYRAAFHKIVRASGRHHPVAEIYFKNIVDRSIETAQRALDRGEEIAGI